MSGVRRLTALAAAATVAVSGLLLGPGAPSALADGSTPTPSVTPAAAPAVVGGERLAGKGVVTDLPDGVPAPPAFKAGSFVLADLDTGDVLVSKNAHGRYLPASTLKTLTVLTTLPLVDPSTVVTAEASDVVDGTLVGLVPGSHYTVEQLLQGAMLSSGNDAATALARVAGGVPQTVERMQAEARHLGADDTTVRNASGLDARGQLTSAYDLALVTRAALGSQDFRRLVATKRVRFPGKDTRGHKKRTAYQIQNHNTLIYNYPGAIGVKNGYTVAARWTMIGAATRGGHTYVMTALHRGESSWRTEAAMLDWAFAHGSQARPVGRLVQPGEVESAREAAGAPTVQAAAAAGTSAVRQSRTPADSGSSLRTTVGGIGLGAAGLAVVLLGLAVSTPNARERRRRQRARSARR